MALAKFSKQPADVLDFDVSYADWLNDREDTISSISVTSDDGMTIGNGINGAASPIANAGVVRFWALGGTDGVTYKVTVTVVTTGGRTKQAEVQIKVRES